MYKFFSNNYEQGQHFYGKMTPHIIELLLKLHYLFIDSKFLIKVSQYNFYTTHIKDLYCKQHTINYFQKL